ncbi:uncharacterized protein LOC108093371 [Drosophila ficusphila]|uniref:uncharacterized protein LOC108093371 n=1 Tax=Drosophila ficusphila TaxID=30025 RepID=UPI0007E895C6|nr:uncharacterized protein LOC108093371 [Drosophila ficusphila]
MGPRKRISIIASRTVPPVVQNNESKNCRTVGTQTEFRSISQPKRKKVKVQAKDISQAVPQPGPNCQSGPISEAFLQPCPNEKTCQTDGSGAVEPADRVVTPKTGNRQMSYLKNLVNNRREEANESDRKRLASLLETINEDPPPPWHVASQMWLEVDRLENRIEAYEESEREAKKMKMDQEQDQGPSQGNDKEKELEQGKDQRKEN